MFRSVIGKDRVDVVFEFQAYMTDQVIIAQKRMADINKFTFLGNGAANEAGHLANMTNQLRAVLYDIRTECIGYQNEQSASELRSCPYCGEVWSKVEGCDAYTECGDRPTCSYDVRDSTYAVLSTFTFIWDDNNLKIIRTGERTLESVRVTLNSRGEELKELGCGKFIKWSEMKPITTPDNWKTAKVSTSDIKLLQTAVEGFEVQLDGMLDDYGKDLQPGSRTSAV